MGDDSVPADGDAPDGPAANGTSLGHGAIAVDARGDVVLHVTFDTSPETLRKARKAALAASRKAGSSAPPPPVLKPQVKVAYRVSSAELKKHSNYFSRLFSDSKFREAKLITESHAQLAARGQKPADVDAAQLPWIDIVDDDEATQTAARERVFEDMLRILHRQLPKITRATMSYLATLAITADRFDCVTPVSRCLNGELKFKWPVTTTKPMRDDSGKPTDVEQVLRQKILVSWLLGQPMRLHTATRELIMRGSRRWTVFDDGESEADATAAWWTLPDDLEQELQHRRECILNTIASVQRHFLHLYSSRDRQCKLGYDSSTACDSFQLGQLLKFLVAKDLLFLVDFSPASIDVVPDTALLDVDELVSTLRQCPSYQVDKFHTNCGPRNRLKPILDYIRIMLSATSVSIPLADWKRRRADVSWPARDQPVDGDESDSRAFAFTRALANDQRLKHEGVMYAERMAKILFTATSWNWTPEV